MRRGKFVVLLAADGQDFACQLLDLRVIGNVNCRYLLICQLRRNLHANRRLALVEFRDDLISGLHKQSEDVAVCAGSLLLRFGRLRYLCHFECDRRALRLADNRLERFLIEADSAVFSIEGQARVCLIADVLYKRSFQLQLHVLRAFRVGSRDLEDNLCGLLLRSLLEDLALILCLDGRCRGSAADLDLGWRGGSCGAGLTGCFYRRLRRGIRAYYGAHT